MLKLIYVCRDCVPFNTLGLSAKAQNQMHYYQGFPKPFLKLIYLTNILIKHPFIGLGIQMRITGNSKNNVC